MDYTNLVVSILAGLITAIPLVVELVKYVKSSVKEKNWVRLVELVLALMKDAEASFDNGADRKKWVVAMAVSAAHNINYEVDEKALEALVDSLCDMSKTVNRGV